MATKTKTPKADTVLVLRTCAADMTAYNGFKWPEMGPVDCPDWSDDYECGHGLRGLLWGEGDGGLLSWTPYAMWLVVEVLASDIRTGQGALVGKCKFPRGTVVYCGTRYGAAEYIGARSVNRAICGGTATAGDAGTATAGYAGTIDIKWWSGTRYRKVIGYVGEDGILPNVAYRCEAGKLVPVDPAKAAEVAAKIAAEGNRD